MAVKRNASVEENSSPRRGEKNRDNHVRSISIGLEKWRKEKKSRLGDAREGKRDDRVRDNISVVSPCRLSGRKIRRNTRSRIDRCRRAKKADKMEREKEEAEGIKMDIDRVEEKCGKSRRRGERERIKR